MEMPTNITVEEAELITLDEHVDVFDIQVDVDESFICGGVVLSNSSICRTRDNLRYTPVEHKPIGHNVPWLQGPGRSHWNCVVAGTMVSSPTEISGATMREFSGHVIDISLSDGKLLSCTWNHPILTKRGWVPAAHLNESDFVIVMAAGWAQEVSAVFDKVSASNVAVVQAQAADMFHGDGAAGAQMVGATSWAAGKEASADEIASGRFGGVSEAGVTGIFIRRFSGHVYNLETAAGFYIANGIVTHNCRSSSVPITKSWRELGIDEDELPISTRASMDGYVPADMTYSDWLKKQPRSVVDEILGEKKAKLFLDGGVTLDRFEDRAGNELSLRELRQRESEAFRKAGLS